MVVAYLLKYGGIKYGHSSEVDNVTHRRIDIDEVDRLVKTQLDGTDGFGKTHLKHHLIGSVGCAEIGEYESVDILSVQAAEREIGVTHFLVDGVVHLHFSGDRQLGLEFVHLFDNVMHKSRLDLLVGTEIGI